MSETTNGKRLLPARVARLRERCWRMAGEPVELTAALAQGFRASAEEPSLIVRRAKAEAHAFENCPVRIDDDELIVGGWAKRPVGREEWDKVREGGEGALAGGTDHMAIDNEKLLAVGVNGFIAEIEERLAGLDRGDTGYQEKKEFYRASLVALRGLAQLGKRYAAEARRLAALEKRKRRRAELERVAEACEQVPAGPARDFWEAVQSAWFVHVAFRAEVGLMSPGRPDQYLCPYYVADRKARRLTREHARTLLQCWFVKLNELFVLPQGLTVGGQDADGRECSNELSHLLLEAAEGLRMVNPSIALAWNRRTPRALMRRAARMMARGVGHPAIFNDEVIIPGLVEAGVAERDARRYIHSTCVEITPIACSNIWIAHGYINLAKALELALRDGVDPVSGESVGVRTGPAESLTSFEMVVEAYQRQLAEMVRGNAEQMDEGRRHAAGASRQPLLSPFVHDCLERGTDLSNGGGRYNLTYPQAVGTANVVDSLMAIRHFVFEHGELPLRQLVQMCDRNFEGAEVWRQRLLNFPMKWGNDIDQVDALARELCDFWYSEVTKYVNPLGGRYRPGFLCWIQHGVLGKQTGATPDGRRAGTALADSMGAAQGRDVNGPTAVVRSVNRLNFVPANGGMVLNLKFSPSAVKGPEGPEKLRALLETYLQNGGFQVQVNVVGRETLLEAKAHPEQWRGLVVRVGGYADYFTALDPVLQDEIIARSEHA